MTEKRFFQDGNEILTWIRDKETWEKLKTDTDVINKLNELNEQNEVCREAYKELKQEVIKLNKENKEFKKENDALKKFVKVNFSDMMVEKMEKELSE